MNPINLSNTIYQLLIPLILLHKNLFNDLNYQLIVINFQFVSNFNSKCKALNKVMIIMQINQFSVLLTYLKLNLTLLKIPQFIIYFQLNYVKPK